MLYYDKNFNFSPSRLESLIIFLCGKAMNHGLKYIGIAIYKFTLIFVYVQVLRSGNKNVIHVYCEFLLYLTGTLMIEVEKLYKVIKLNRFLFFCFGNQRQLLRDHRL